MVDWKSTDTNQTIWEIHLETDIISVWDSIKVGMNRSDIEKFGKAKDGFCRYQEDDSYSCFFANFSAVYIFKNDSLKEMTITRNCDKYIEAYKSSSEKP
mgnify:CR=1 FL=1